MNMAESGVEVEFVKVLSYQSFAERVYGADVGGAEKDELSAKVLTKGRLFIYLDCRI